ncbi:unnamed protein product [Durusdinium trenchii]|uniref:3'-5' exonuclease domain-containing protein n=1 Tax=Durusdinium trenchii TaxID=1381693 RepID=A0ABP0RU55_9DINO
MQRLQTLVYGKRKKNKFVCLFVCLLFCCCEQAPPSQTRRHYSRFQSEDAESSVGFLGGDVPGLLSDIPLAAALLTSTWWRAQILSDAGERRLSQLQGPLKGRDLVLWWLMKVMAHERTSFAFKLACDDLTHELHLEELETIPHDLLPALSKACPPANQPTFASPMTAEQQAHLAEKRAEALRLKESLIEAVKSRDVALVRELVLKGAPVDTTIRLRATRGLPKGTGFSAAGAGSQRWVEVSLLHLAMSVCIQEPESATHPAHKIAEDLGMTFSRQAFRPCFGGSMLEVFQSAQMNLDSSDSDGLSPIFYAAMCGNTCCLQHLLESGGTSLLEHRDNYGRNILYWAVANNQPSTVEWILANASGRITVDDANVEGQTALAKAAWCDLPEIAKILLAHRADPTITDKHGRHALHKAAWGPDGGRNGVKVVGGQEVGGSPQCVELFLRADFLRSIAVRDVYGATPVQVASTSGAVEALDLLLQTQEGRAEATAALAATAFRGQQECLKLLLDAKADLYQCNPLGFSAFDCAVAGESASGLGELLTRLLKEEPLSGSALKLLESAMNCACRLRNSVLLEMLLSVEETRDFLHQEFVALCVQATLDKDLEPPKAWPPFAASPKMPIKWTNSQALVALNSFGPASEEDLKKLKRCCVLLLKAGAPVSSATLALTIRNHLGSDLSFLEMLTGQMLRFNPEIHQLSWPLVAAIQTHHRPAVQSLLDHAADPTSEDGFPIALAAALGHSDIMAWFLGSCPSCKLLCREEFSSPLPWTTIADKSGTLCGQMVPLQVVAARFGHQECMALVDSAARGLAPTTAGPDSCLREGQLLKARGTSLAPRVMSFRVEEREEASATSASQAENDGFSSFCQLIQIWERRRFDADPAPLPSRIHFVSTSGEAFAAIETLRADLHGRAVLGVDVECYRDVICTVQLSSGVHHFVLDGLVLHQEMSSILGFLAEPDIIKVFHSPRNDLRWLRINFDISPCNIFDTASAAMKLNSVFTTTPSLKELSMQLLHVQLDKRYQQADWRLRPLTPEMLQYAATDASVLVPLFQRFCCLLSPDELQDSWSATNKLNYKTELPLLRVTLDGFQFQHSESPLTSS